MGRKVAYWASTIIICLLSLFAAFSYLSGEQHAVQGFAHAGYPQHLRIILGVAKLLGAITLLAPGFPTLKEWAYAGFTFAWISVIPLPPLTPRTLSLRNTMLSAPIEKLWPATNEGARALQCPKAGTSSDTAPRMGLMWCWNRWKLSSGVIVRWPPSPRNRLGWLCSWRGRSGIAGW